MAMNLTAQRVGTEVRVALVRAGASQSDLGQHLGLSQTAISRRLLGEVAFDVTEIVAAAEFLGVAASDLLGPATAVA